MKKDGAEIRRERMEAISRSIHKNLETQNPLTYTKTVATLAYNTGLTQHRIEEYLSVLETLSHFIINREKDTISKIVTAED
jgi:hypothetical protein